MLGSSSLLKLLWVLWVDLEAWTSWADENHEKWQISNFLCSKQIYFLMNWHIFNWQPCAFIFVYIMNKSWIYINYWWTTTIDLLVMTKQTCIKIILCSIFITFHSLQRIKIQKDGQIGRGSRTHLEKGNSTTWI